MLRFDTENHKFQKLEEKDLKTAKILERYDLQKTIVSSWELFKNEIGYPEAFLIGQEIKPHTSTDDSIDLVAYDTDSSSILIIELKRDKNKLQLLQALSYAAMVSKWGVEELVSNIQKESNPSSDELIDLIKDNGISSTIKVILVSEYYDPEVILTADWLSTSHNVDISAFSLNLMSLKEETFLQIEQKYPLKELQDTYITRSRRGRRQSDLPDVEWEDILPKLKYSFAAKALELCRKLKDGDPSRRRFGSIRSNYENLAWVSINFRENYINVYVKGDFNGLQEYLQGKFKDDMTINSWRDGYSVLVETESQFNDLVAWLKLE